ncbi:hypothetical protein Alg130_11120 [Pyrenophora tritici-repentis]|nr:hypothetical protein Alg130_11120 [Pyrenophora tritici-repentis]
MQSPEDTELITDASFAMQFPFMRLALELRNRIYEIAIQMEAERGYIRLCIDDGRDSSNDKETPDDETDSSNNKNSNDNTSSADEKETPDHKVDSGVRRKAPIRKKVTHWGFTGLMQTCREIRSEFSKLYMGNMKIQTTSHSLQKFSKVFLADTRSEAVEVLLANEDREGFNVDEDLGDFVASEGGYTVKDNGVATILHGIFESLDTFRDSLVTCFEDFHEEAYYPVKDEGVATLLHDLFESPDDCRDGLNTFFNDVDKKGYHKAKDIDMGTYLYEICEDSDMYKWERTFRTKYKSISLIISTESTPILMVHDGSFLGECWRYQYKSEEDFFGHLGLPGAFRHNFEFTYTE